MTFFFFLNESTLDFLHNPSTLSPFQLADSSDPSWFCSHAISSRSFLGLHRLHTPSATSHILSQASVSLSALHPICLVRLTRTPITRRAPETRALFDSSQCPSPLPHSVLSIQQVPRKGLLQSAVHLLCHITSVSSTILVFLTLLHLSSMTPQRV